MRIPTSRKYSRYCNDTSIPEEELANLGPLHILWTEVCQPTEPLETGSVSAKKIQPTSTDESSTFTQRKEKILARLVPYLSRYPAHNDDHRNTSYAVDEISCCFPREQLSSNYGPG